MLAFAHEQWQKWRYRHWLSTYDSPTARELEILARATEALPRKPLISVIVPVFNPRAEHLIGMIESVRRQIYPNWELCLADDASDVPHVIEIVRHYANLDERIKWVSRPINGHISAASNSALELSSGDYIALLDHDDVLAPHALAMVAKYLYAHPSARLLYSDEDKLGERGGRHSPYFKPGWDPELILQTNYFNHLGVFEAALVRALGGFRVGLEGSQDHDLLLRCVRVTGNEAVVHIPHVLYHWRATKQSTARAVSGKPYAAIAGAQAVREHLAAMGRPGRVQLPSAEFPFMTVVDTMPMPEPSVLMMLDARGSRGELASCLGALLERTNYSNYRVCVVTGYDGKVLPVDDPRASLHSVDDGEEALIINTLVASSECDFVCLLDARVRVADPEWLARLTSVAAVDGVGLAGARLCRMDGSVAAAGMVKAGKAGAVVARPGRTADSMGYFGLNRLTRQVSLLPGVGVMARRGAFLQAGGAPREARYWREWGPILSSRMIGLGLRNVIAGNSVLMHGMCDVHGREALPRNGSSDEDAFYNPNLALNEADASFRLAFPPRIGKFD